MANTSPRMSDSVANHDGLQEMMTARVQGGSLSCQEFPQDGHTHHLALLLVGQLRDVGTLEMIMEFPRLGIPQVPPLEQPEESLLFGIMRRYRFLVQHQLISDIAACRGMKHVSCIPLDVFLIRERNINTAITAVAGPCTSDQPDGLRQVPEE